MHLPYQSLISMSSLRSCRIHMLSCVSFFFFFNDTATTEIYTLSLHDALPISCTTQCEVPARCCTVRRGTHGSRPSTRAGCSAGSLSPQSTCVGTPMSSIRSEEHTSELQSQSNLVCRLLLEKNKRSNASGQLPTRAQ